MKAIGIDLGTTNSLVAAVVDGEARTLPDLAGRMVLPSVVTYARGLVFVGQEALDLADEFPQDTVTSIKRLMGRTLAEGTAHGLGSNRLEQDGAVVRVLAGGGRHTPMEISASILRVLNDRADRVLADTAPSGLFTIAEPGQGGLTPRRPAVITVPAYFDDTQRQATRQAGRLAGLEVLRLLNEPTAAALAYGLDKQATGRFAVFDLGGGTFDISVLHLIDGVFEVLATGGDSQLGGDDLDRAVAHAMLSEAGVDAATASPGLRRRAVAAAERAKIALTDLHLVPYALRLDDDRTFERDLDRETLRRIWQPTLARIEAPCRQAMRDAGLRPSELDGVVLVGGSTRSPLVQRLAAEIFEQRPLSDLDPEEVVALGAATLADLLSQTSELRGTEAGDVLLLDVTPLSLGLETMGGVVEKVIPRGSAIPASRAQEFTTFQDGQAAMDIHVLQGERELVEDCRSLARFRLEGIPPRGAGAARVRVTYQVDADGILSVSARETSSGVEQAVVIQPTHGLTDADVEAMLADSLQHAEGDAAARAARERAGEARQVLAALERARREDADLLEPDEASALDAITADLQAAIEATDADAMRELTELLDRAASGFAQRRMERALRQGLVEQRVNITELDTALADAPTGGGEHH